LEFADISSEWKGFQPKFNAEELIMKKEAVQHKDYQARLIQNIIRRKFAYKKFKAIRDIYLINKAVPKFQALYRSYVTRCDYNDYKLQETRRRKAIQIQSAFRLYRVKLMKRMAVRQRKILNLKMKSAIMIQRLYHGMKGRRRVIMRRNEIMNIKLEEAKIHAIKNMKAIVIQCMMMQWYARCRVIKMREARRLRLIKLLKQSIAIVNMQRVVRGKLGKMRALRVREELRVKAMRWHCARELQRVYRGYVKRKYVKHLKELLRQKMRLLSCIRIQSFWRKVRAIMLVSILRALKELRKKQQFFAREIQRVVRGVKCRHELKKNYEALEEERRLTRAAIKIQKIFRGHKGREACEIERELRLLEEKARPLFDKLRTLEEDAITLEKSIKVIESSCEIAEFEVSEIEKELDHATKTAAKFTDSKRVNGIPQRFLTKFLIVRLQDCLDKEKVRED
jgi:hypothetical protein